MSRVCIDGNKYIMLDVAQTQIVEMVDLFWLWPIQLAH